MEKSQCDINRVGGPSAAIALEELVPAVVPILLSVLEHVAELISKVKGGNCDKSAIRTEGATRDYAQSNSSDLQI